MIHGLATLGLRLGAIYWIVDGIWIVLRAFTMRAEFGVDGSDTGLYSDYLVQYSIEGIFGIALGFFLILFSSSAGKLVSRGIPERVNPHINGKTIIHAGTVIIGIWLIADVLPDLLVYSYSSLRVGGDNVQPYFYGDQARLISQAIVGVVLILFDSWLIKPFRWLRYGSAKRQETE